MHDALCVELVGRVLRRTEHFQDFEQAIQSGTTLNLTLLALNLSRYVNGVAQAARRGVAAACSPATPSTRSPTASTPPPGRAGPSRTSTTATSPAGGWTTSASARPWASPGRRSGRRIGRQKRRLIAAREPPDQRRDGQGPSHARLRPAGDGVQAAGPPLRGHRAAPGHRGEGAAPSRSSSPARRIRRTGRARSSSSGSSERGTRSRPDVRVAYLENYDMELARDLTSGVDVWLNTPEPPLEASGTSGMKAALNGVPSLSVLDGWWIEGHIEGITGWSIGEAGRGAEDRGDRTKDAACLYEKLEKPDRSDVLSGPGPVPGRDGPCDRAERLLLQHPQDGPAVCLERLFPLNPGRGDDHGEDRPAQALGRRPATAAMGGRQGASPDHRSGLSPIRPVRREGRRRGDDSSRSAKKGHPGGRIGPGTARGHQGGRRQVQAFGRNRSRPEERWPQGRSPRDHPRDR